MAKQIILSFRNILLFKYNLKKNNKSVISQKRQTFAWSYTGYNMTSIICLNFSIGVAVTRIVRQQIHCLYGFGISDNSDDLFWSLPIYSWFYFNKFCIIIGRNLHTAKLGREYNVVCSKKIIPFSQYQYGIINRNFCLFSWATLNSLTELKR